MLFEWDAKNAIHIFFYKCRLGLWYLNESPLYYRWQILHKIAISTICKLHTCLEFARKQLSSLSTLKVYSILQGNLTRHMLYYMREIVTSKMWLMIFLKYYASHLHEGTLLWKYRFLYYLSQFSHYNRNSNIKICTKNGKDIHHSLRSMLRILD